MNYKKKNPSDPNPEDINPEIVRFAKSNAFLRGPFELFLNGDLTWTEALETMILLVTKEYNAQGNLLISVLQERPTQAILLSGATGKLVKALPKHPAEVPSH